MNKFLRGFAPATIGALAFVASAAGQGYPPYPPPSYPPRGYPPPAYPATPFPAQSYPTQPGAPQQPYPSQSNPPPQQAAVSSSPTCVRLEAQLATLNSSTAAADRADQIKREEDAIARQQAELDRTLAQAQRIGCGQGFFALFSGFSPRCGPLTSRIQQLRGNLDSMMSEVERLKSGGSDQDTQRTALIGQLAQNNCGAQYTQAARAAGPQGFFEALLGGGGTLVSPGGNGAPAGTYRTVCVRTCDGYYFPISYSTVPARFAADAQTCQRLCPAAEVNLYTYRNPGEQIEQAVSINGAPYTALPNAFRYRKELVSGCTCRPPGESWAQALRGADDTTTLERGDIVVTDKNVKALSQVPQSATAKPRTPAAEPNPAPSAAGQGTGDDKAAASDDQHRKVRIVGPPFLTQQ